MKTRNSIINSGGINHNGNSGLLVLSGSSEEEAANVVAIGEAIGVDFSEVEEEVLEEIVRREEEDTARYEALKG